MEKQIGENIFFEIWKFKESTIVKAEHFGKRTFWWEHLFRGEHLFLGRAIFLKWLREFDFRGEH